jgi:RNA 3'-terminal phosphate cyclase (ATP)
MLEIDSSRGEGGGQMVRTSVAMSAITGIETKLTRIRENRPTNGLSKQHCTAVNAVATMTGSEVIGNYPGSKELIFKPGNDIKYDLEMDIGTAGSISLVLQAVLLAAKNIEKTLHLDIHGGTNVMWAPPIDSYQQVLFPLMKDMGIEASVDIIDRGFYPEGGGHVESSLEPIGDISPINHDSLGDLIGIKGICFIQNLPDWMAEQMVSGCLSVLGDTELDMKYQRTDGRSKGAGISLVANYENGKIGSNVLTSRGHPAKQAGEDVAKDLLQEMKCNTTMDVHTADQLLPYMAMADGKSEFTVSRISKHLLSQMDTLESFLDVKFGVKRIDDIYQFSVSPGGSS